jgi:hypothetical protein
VGVLDVEGRLTRPPFPVVVRDIGGHRTRRLDHGQRRRSRETERGVEDGQIRLDGGRAVGVDDDDRLARAVDPLAEERLQVVRRLELVGRVTGHVVLGLTRRRRRRSPTLHLGGGMDDGGMQDAGLDA